MQGIHGKKGAGEGTNDSSKSKDWLAMTLKRGLMDDSKTFGEREKGVIVPPDPFWPV